MLGLIEESDLKGQMGGATVGQRGIIRVVVEQARRALGVSDGKEKSRQPFINIAKKLTQIGWGCLGRDSMPPREVVDQLQKDSLEQSQTGTFVACF